MNLDDASWLSIIFIFWQSFRGIWRKGEMAKILDERESSTQYYVLAKFQILFQGEK